MRGFYSIHKRSFQLCCRNITCIYIYIQIAKKTKLLGIKHASRENLSVDGFFLLTCAHRLHSTPRPPRQTGTRVFPLEAIPRTAGEVTPGVHFKAPRARVPAMWNKVQHTAAHLWNGRRRWMTCGSCSHSRACASSLVSVRVCTYCGRKPSRTTAGSGGTGWSFGPAACIPCRTSSHIGTPECSCSGPHEESSRWPPRWSVSQSGTKKGLCTKASTFATVAVRCLISVQMNRTYIIVLKYSWQLYVKNLTLDLLLFLYFGSPAEEIGLLQSHHCRFLLPWSPWQLKQTESNILKACFHATSMHMEHPP